MGFQDVLKCKLALYNYSNAVSNWNYLAIDYCQDNRVSGFGFDEGQYYFDFGF